MLRPGALRYVHERGDHGFGLPLKQVPDQLAQEAAVKSLPAHARAVDVGVANLIALKQALFKEPLQGGLDRIQRDAAALAERCVNGLGLAVSTGPQVVHHSCFELAKERRTDGTGLHQAKLSEEKPIVNRCSRRKHVGGRSNPSLVAMAVVQVGDVGMLVSQRRVVMGVRVGLTERR